MWYFVMVLSLYFGVHRHIQMERIFWILLCSEFMNSVPCWADGIRLQ